MEIREFTYFGDLLGTSELYAIHNNVAYQQLDTFYNTVFDTFKPLAETDNNLMIYLFSDSLFITGQSIELVLEGLGSVYCKLFKQSILLRGAMVGGLLDFDPRIQLANITKGLPRTNVLFRAVKLEKSYRGARLLIENELAQNLLPSDWYTNDEYERNVLIHEDISVKSFKRKIAPNKDSLSYQYLWPLEDSNGLESFNVKNLLKGKALFTPDHAKDHLKETKKLFEVAEYWSNISNQKNSLFNF
jgi:hypothetical protein